MEYIDKPIEFQSKKENSNFEQEQSEVYDENPAPSINIEIGDAFAPFFLNNHEILSYRDLTSSIENYLSKINNYIIKTCNKRKNEIQKEIMLRDDFDKNLKTLNENITTKDSTQISLVKNQSNNFKFIISPKVSFKVENQNYEKSGNNIKKNNKRYQNGKRKIIRNFLQHILIFWICDSNKNQKLKKIKGKSIYYQYTEYKGKKLKQIYGNSTKDDDYNNKIIQNAKGNMLIKLNFTFEEAFEAFCYDEKRELILNNLIIRILNSNLKKEEKEKYEKLNRKDFFVKLKHDYEFINENIKENGDDIFFKHCLNEIKSEFNINLA